MSGERSRGPRPAAGRARRPTADLARCSTSSTSSSASRVASRTRSAAAMRRATSAVRSRSARAGRARRRRTGWWRPSAACRARRRARRPRPRSRPGPLQVGRRAEAGEVRGPVRRGTDSWWAARVNATYPSRSSSSASWALGVDAMASGALSRRAGAGRGRRRAAAPGITEGTVTACATGRPDGNRLSQTPTRNTASHSRPLDRCTVSSLTESASVGVATSRPLP